MSKTSEISGATIAEEKSATSSATLSLESFNRREKAPAPQTGPYIVEFEGQDDPSDPKNWPTWKKRTTTAMIAFLVFQVPVGSSIISPAVGQIEAEFRSTNQLLYGFVISVYVLGFAFGPLLFAPASEIWGRRVIYNVTNVLTFGMTIGCALAPSLNALIVFRFLTGCFGAVPMSVGGGTITDFARPEERGKYIALVALAPIVGPVIGAIIGGFFAQAEGWRWCLWLMVILAGTSTLICLVFLPETYSPTILAAKAKKLRKQTGNQAITISNDHLEVKGDIFINALTRPFRLLLHCPVIFPISLHLALMHAYVYILFTIYPVIYRSQYHWSLGLSGLAYLGVGMGDFLGAVLIGKTADKVSTARAKKHPTGARLPESRLILMAAFAPCVPIGLLWTGWAAQQQTHWIVPQLGAVPLGIGLVGSSLSAQLYMMDSYTKFAASAIAVTAFMRSIFGALLPLAGAPMYDALGVGLGNTVLACISLLSIVLALALLKWGEMLRTKYPFENVIEAGKTEKQPTHEE